MHLPLTPSILWSSSVFQQPAPHSHRLHRKCNPHREPPLLELHPRKESRHLRYDVLLDCLGTRPSVHMQVHTAPRCSHPPCMPHSIRVGTMCNAATCTTRCNAAISLALCGLVHNLRILILECCTGACANSATATKCSHDGSLPGCLECLCHHPKPAARFCPHTGLSKAAQPGWQLCAPASAAAPTAGTPTAATTPTTTTAAASNQQSAECCTHWPSSWNVPNAPTSHASLCAGPGEPHCTATAPCGCTASTTAHAIHMLKSVAMSHETHASYTPLSAVAIMLQAAVCALAAGICLSAHILLSFRSVTQQVSFRLFHGLKSVQACL